MIHSEEPLSSNIPHALQAKITPTFASPDSQVLARTKHRRATPRAETGETPADSRPGRTPALARSGDHRRGPVPSTVSRTRAEKTKQSKGDYHTQLLKFLKSLLL